ncbi:MAG: hypothetical protein ABR907_17495 [Terracidiphilus sp.]|jgi:hypothetical protein
MKVERIKQIFLEFVRRLPVPGMPDLATNTEPQLLTGTMLIRGNLIMRDDLASGYLEALEEMHDIASADETWNKDAIDDLFAKQVLTVATASTDQRPAVIAEAAKEFAVRLNEVPTAWQIDLSVFGANFDLNGLSFGRIVFIADNIRAPYSVPGLIEPNIDTAFLLARLSVQAINRKTAVEKASEIVDQHLNVLNAICADLIPSRTHLFHVGASVRRFGISRSTAATESEPEVRLHTESNAVLLSRADCDAFLRKRGGAKASELLLTSNTFAGRVISALETAGEACIELKTHRAFLLHAIALESVVLGRQTQSEIGYQLSARVAHLLGVDLESRRNIAKTVNRLYGLRSKIVHTGETEIAASDLEMIRFLSMNTLYALLSLKPFANMASVEELEQWFKDRMLGAVDDLS